MAFFIVSDQGGVVIDVKGDIAKSGQPLDAFTQKKNGDHTIDNQLWTFEQPPDNQQGPYGYQGYYFIQSKLRGKDGNDLVIDIKGESFNPSAPVEVNAKVPSQNGVSTSQLWYFMPGPGGYCFVGSYQAVVNDAPPTVIDIKGGSHNSGAPLQVDAPKTSQSPGGNDYQLWKFVDENGKAVPIPAPPPQLPGGWPAAPGSDGGNPYQ
jgi:hypothetical protein